VTGRQQFGSAFVLEYITITWMVIVAAVAIGSGIGANSLTLIAFGVDSIIELASAGFGSALDRCEALFHLRGERLECGLFIGHVDGVSHHRLPQDCSGHVKGNGCMLLIR
jgi:hypothetical protein